MEVTVGKGHGHRRWPQAVRQHRSYRFHPARDLQGVARKHRPMAVVLA
jgi:hypothetical protein